MSARSHRSTRRRPPPRERGRITCAVRRIVAATVLLAVCAAAPVALVRLTGSPASSVAELRGAWRSGRISDRAVVAIGVLLFTLLWAWFTATALSEVVRVVRWRSERDPRRLPLEPTSSSPTGWVRALVRIALVSSTAALLTSVVGLRAFGGSSPSRAAALGFSSRPVAASAPARPTALTARQEPPSVVARPRDTAYAIAHRLGDDTLREEIVALNSGSTGPDGRIWRGGVFPVGMRVLLPEHFARPPGRSDDAVLDAGHEAVHVVVPGECWWRIAGDHLRDEEGRAPSPTAVLHETERLRALNAPRLGHHDPNLIRPGEQVVWTDPPAADATSARPRDERRPSGEPTPVPAVPPAAAPVGSPPPPPADAPPVAPASGPARPVLPTAVDPAAHGGERDIAPIGAVAGLLCVGAVGLLEARRRGQLRRAGQHARLPARRDELTLAERELRRLGAADRAARLDLASRSASALATELGRQVVALRLGDDGQVRVHLASHLASPFARPVDGPVAAGAVAAGRVLADPDRPLDGPAPWTVASGDADVWELAVAVDDVALAPSARRASTPGPLLVEVGRDPADTASWFVDLAAVGLLCLDVQGRSAVALPTLRAVAAELALSPFAAPRRVVNVGLRTGISALDDDPAAVVNDGCAPLAADDLEAALVAAEAAEGGAVVVDAGPATALDASLVEYCTSTVRGIATGEQFDPDVAQVAVVTGREVAGATWVLRAPRTRIIGTWRLDPLGVELVPVALHADRARSIDELMSDAARPLLGVATMSPSSEMSPRAASSLAPPRLDPRDVEPDWALIVRLLGPVRVEARDGTAAGFGRSKALELVAWLATHRERATRAAARTALWDLDVSNATFANVVSDARRGLGRCVDPGEGEEWIGRTLTEQLVLHPGVVTDEHLLRRRLAVARTLPPGEAIAVLRPGVELVEGLPFESTGYLWPDAEGTTSSLVILATESAAVLAEHHLALGDVEGVFWATGRGLAVMPGHEELIAIRMRAHAGRGDLAGVRTEWQVYERCLSADPWSGSDPSPKLLAVRRELLAAG